MSPLWSIIDIQGAGPDHRSAATPRVFLHAHSACAAGDVLRQHAAVLTHAPRVRLTHRAQKLALFSDRTLDVLAPFHLPARCQRDSTMAQHLGWFVLTLVPRPC